MTDRDGQRGNSLENERVERERVTACLEMLGGRAMVLGHSITAGGRITSRFGGKVFRADVGMAYEGGGVPQALVIENDEVRVFNARTGVIGTAVAELPDGESALSRVDRRIVRCSVLPRKSPYSATALPVIKAISMKDR